MARYIKMTNQIKKSIILSLTALILITLFIPWILYGIGLNNIKGRPAFAAIREVSEKESLEIWQELLETGPVQVKKLNPWHYVLLFFNNMNPNIKTHPGARVAWYVARNYNSNNLKNKRMSRWHLSGAAMTIWLTRNWSVQDIMAKAIEIKKIK